MRYKKRETSSEKAWEIFDHCDYGIVSMVDEEQHPYSVPLNLARIKHQVYFHCAVEGRKLTLIKLHPEVFVSMVAKEEVCIERLTTYYESCSFQGIAEIVENAQEKEEALHAICKKYAKDHAYPAITAACMKDTIVVRIRDIVVSGKQNRKS